MRWSDQHLEREAGIDGLGQLTADDSTLDHYPRQFMRVCQNLVRASVSTASSLKLITVTPVWMR
jgi:hypothetical protein